MLAPDVYLSENFVRVLLEHAAAGTEVLQISAWHTAERQFFAALDSRKLLEPRSDRDFRPIRPGIDAVALGAICSDAVHACVACMEWASASFDDSATFVWWRLPGAPGLLLHCMYWMSMGLDFSALKHHHVYELESATIESLYVQDNFGPEPKLAVIDSGASA